MGTNYYLDWPGRHDGDGVGYTPAVRVHVCKSARSWHGIRDQYDLEAVYADEPLTSVAAWWRYLERAVSEGAVLYTENGVKESVQDLRAWAEKVPRHARSYQHQWVLDNPTALGNDPSRSWADRDGFSFWDGDFS